MAIFDDGWNDRGAVKFPKGTPRSALELIRYLTNDGTTPVLPRKDPMHLLRRRIEMEDKLQMADSNLPRPRTCDEDIESYFGLCIDRSKLPTVVQTKYPRKEPSGPSQRRSLFRAEGAIIRWMYPGVDATLYMKAIFLNAKGFDELIKEMGQGYKANHVLDNNIPRFIKYSYESDSESESDSDSDSDSGSGSDDGGCERHSKYTTEAEKLLRRFHNMTITGL